MRRFCGLAPLLLAFSAACGGGRGGVVDTGKPQPEDAGATPEEKTDEKADDKTGESSGEQTAEADDARRFRPRLESDPCDMLSAGMVATVAGVEADTLLASNPMRDMCRYDWTDGKASVGFIRISQNAGTARRHFEAAYSNEGREKKAYELIEGLGDAAVWEAAEARDTSKSDLVNVYPNEVKVRVSNMIFTVSYTGPDDRPYRDETVALARAIVSALPPAP